MLCEVGFEFLQARQFELVDGIERVGTITSSKIELSSAGTRQDIASFEVIPFESEWFLSWTRLRIKNER